MELLDHPEHFAGIIAEHPPQVALYALCGCILDYQHRLVVNLPTIHAEPQEVARVFMADIATCVAGLRTIVDLDREMYTRLTPDTIHEWFRVHAGYPDGSSMGIMRYLVHQFGRVIEVSINNYLRLVATYCEIETPVIYTAMRSDIRNLSMIFNTIRVAGGDPPWNDPGADWIVSI